VAQHLLLPSAATSRLSMGAPAAMPPPEAVIPLEAVAHEHAYAPQPIWEYSPGAAVADCALRPTVRRGKLPFRFFGCRVPESAVHARCWLGCVLRAELRKGALFRAELMPECVRTPASLVAVEPETVKPECLWHVWPAGFASVGEGRRGAQTLPPDIGHAPWECAGATTEEMDAVRVLLLISPQDGITIRLYCVHPDRRDCLHRILLQYCEEDRPGLPIPIPDAHTCITKVRAGTDKGDWLDAETRARHAEEQRMRLKLQLQQTLGRATALAFVAHDGEAASTEGLLANCEEIRKAMHEALDAGVLLRPEWRDAARAVVEEVLRREPLQASTASGAACRRRVAALAHHMQDLGIPVLEPAHHF